MVSMMAVVIFLQLVKFMKNLITKEKIKITEIKNKIQSFFIESFE